MTVSGNDLLFVVAAYCTVSLLHTVVYTVSFNGGVPVGPSVTVSGNGLIFLIAAGTACSGLGTCIYTVRLNCYSPISPSVAVSGNSLNVGCTAAVLTSSLKETCLSTCGSGNLYVLAPNVLTGSNTEACPVCIILGFAFNGIGAVTVIDNCTDTSEVDVNACAGSCVPVVAGTDRHVVHLLGSVDGAHVELVKGVGLVDVSTVSRVRVLYVIGENACFIKCEEGSVGMANSKTEVLTLVVYLKGLRRSNLAVFHNVSGDVLVGSVAVSRYRGSVHIDNETILNHTVILYCKTVLYSIAVCCESALKLCFRECVGEVEGVCTVVTAGYEAHLHKEVIDSSGISAL